MRRGFAVRLASVSALALVAVAAGSTWTACSNDPERLPAIGEVVLEIDTDAPVPSAVNRVRIDVFGADGTWLDSRDVVRVNAVDWPLSFAVAAANPNDTRDVVVRLRAYPEGRLRTYGGEHFVDVATFVEPKVAHTLGDLCDAPPPLPPGTFTTRIGDRSVTGHVIQSTVADGGTFDCSSASQGGVAAYKLDITTADTYRFDVVGTVPGAAFFVDPRLMIRKTCTDPLSQIACADDINPDRNKALLLDNTFLPSLVTKLDPGSYTFMVTNRISSATDLTIRWGRAADFPGNQALPDAGASAPTGAEPPRLVVDKVDRTPAKEPIPGTAIDRLVRVQVKPNTALKARVTLRAACSGVQSKLATPLDRSATCIDTEKTLVPLALEPLAANDGVITASQQNNVVPIEPCAPTDSTDAVACVPSGSFLFGANDSPVGDENITTPERLALMHRFWLDKDEMSVARYRALLAKGFVSNDYTPRVNNGPLAKGYLTVGNNVLCTWSPTVLAGADDREGFALNCLSWITARQVCQALGGDLPTEAQWEYAATAAGRPVETRWPWGGDDAAPVDCDRAITGRADPKNPGLAGLANLFTLCASRGFGPAPLATDVGPNGDVSALGIKNLGGGMSEWVLDSAQRYDGECWRAAPLFDPVCWENEPPLRSLRGGSWAYPALPPVRRSKAAPNAAGDTDLSFRCAYRTKPAVTP